MYICLLDITEIIMESKIHSLLEWITPGSPNSHLILPLILRQFLTDSGLLQKGWDPEYYTSLEKTREYAQKYGMLTHGDYSGQTNWQWTKGPWPWEYKEG